MPVSISSGSDWEDEYFPDTDLINDLEAGTLADVGLPEIYHQLVVTNELLGLVFALLVCFAIYGVGRYLQRFLVCNIFKHL